jgi:hypothetical protein
MVTKTDLYNMIVDAAGGRSQYRSFTTPVLEACEFFSEEFPNGIPQVVVDYMMNRFVPFR